MIRKDRDGRSSVVGRYTIETNQRLEAMLAQAKAEILAGAHFRTPAYLAQLHDREPDKLERWLKQAEANQQIFSIEHQGYALYPVYAFSRDEDGNLVLCLAEIIAVLHSKMDGWGMAFWFRSPNNFLVGKRPEDVLNQASEEILLAAREEACSIMHG